MKKAAKQSYKTDLIIQSIVFLPMLFGYFLGLFGNGFWIFGLLMQFFVGVFQVMSGLIRTIQYQDKLRRKYLTVAIPYVLFLILVANFGSYMIGGSVGDILAATFVIVIPVGIAIWYYKLTYDQSKGIERHPQTEKVAGDENLLDDVMV